MRNCSRGIPLEYCVFSCLLTAEVKYKNILYKTQLWRRRLSVGSPVFGIVVAVAGGTGVVLCAFPHVFIGFPSGNKAAEKGGQGFAFSFCQHRKKAGRAFQPVQAVPGHGGAAGLDETKQEAALVFLIALPGDETALFQLYQEFAQGSGTDMEHLQKFPLTDALPLAEDGKDAALRVV